MKIEATCVKKEILQNDSYYIRTFDKNLVPEIHRNCTYFERLKKLMCVKKIREESYSIRRTDLVKVVGNQTESLKDTGDDTIDTYATLKKCLYHNIQDFTVKETENDFEMMLSWRFHAWDRYEYIKRITISRNGKPVQSLSKDDTQFIIKDLRLCSKYKLCVKIETLTSYNKREILDDQCRIVTTKCLKLEPEPILSFVEIIVTIMFFIMVCMIVTLVVYYIAHKPKTAKRQEQEEDMVSEETIADDKDLEQVILRSHFPIHKADHTYVETILLT